MMAPITAITAPPSTWSREQLDQYQASTPADGNFTHPPVLHHLASDVRIVLDPATSIGQFDPAKSSTGDIYVTESSLCFFASSSSTGISITYPTISLHAISRQALPAATAPGHPAASASSSSTEQVCVYCQLDESEGQDFDEMNQPEDDDEDQSSTKELYIFPSAASGDVQAAAQAIYAALSKCAALHPSTDNQPPSAALPSGMFADSMDDDDDDFTALTQQAAADDAVTSLNGQNGSSEWYTGQEDRVEERLTQQGRAQLLRLEGLLEASERQSRPALNGSAVPPHIDEQSQSAAMASQNQPNDKRSRRD